MQNQINRWIWVWQTVLTGLLVAPVLVSSADLFLPPKHKSTLIVPIQRYIRFHRQHTNNNAKNLETLNSRSVLSSHDDSMHNTMVNAEKPVDTMHKMHRIEQLQQKQEPSVYNDQQLDVKNKTAFFDEDDGKNVMRRRPHGQPGNVLNTQFIDDGNAVMLKGNLSMKFNRHKRNATKPMSFAEHLISKLSATNAAVNFSQSVSPDFWLPLDIKSTFYEYSVDGRTRHNNKNLRSVFPQQRPHVIIINGPTRIYGSGTESKFPPFLEFFVQRIQKYFSVYKYEDLSRPALPSQILTDENGVNVTDANYVTEVPLGDT